MATIPSFEAPIPPWLKKILDAQKQIARMMAPLNHANSPAIQLLQSVSANVPHIQVPDMHLAFGVQYSGAVTLLDSMARAFSQMAVSAPEINSPVIDWLNTVTANLPVFSDTYWASLGDGLTFDPKLYIEYYRNALYKAKWFPMTGLQADMNLAIEINDVLSTTGDSKNRVKRMDKVILDYFTKTRIENMKKDWRGLDLPSYLMKILHQAVQAYHRKEYAITAIVLATTWEGIIYSKASVAGEYKTDRKTKDLFEQLMKENEMDGVFDSFFNDFIVYNCYAPEDAIPDVPGRHSLAHSMYSSYPTKKAAMNAIIFTDFLLNLNPVGFFGESN